MRSRAQIHDEFIRRFHHGEAPASASEQELNEVEEALRTKLPLA